MELNNKNISVIGMGRTGIATANFLAQRGARVTLMDQKSGDAFKDTLGLLNPAVRIRFESSEPTSDAELVILSPGMDINSPLLRAARDRGAEIISEIELAYRFASAPIIAITGTNGKSTVTTLTGEILANAGKKVLVGGNLGTPFIELVNEGSADFLVLEISSFQLEGTRTFHPAIAMVLNITPDHMDRHQTLAEYARLKGKIAVNQTAEDHLILNLNDPETLRLREGCPAKTALFSSSTEVAEGSFIRDGVLTVRLNGEEQQVCRVDELSLSMQWQVENILAALLAVSLAGVSPALAADTLKNFSGLPHRMEWVRSVQGIDFVNDSKGTNVGSVQKSLSTFDRPVILIAGGSDKGSDFSPLCRILKERVKHLVLIGETKNKFRQILNGSFSYEDAGTLEDAVKKAYEKAVPGDVVLLSPACASFDMFKNYADRGTQFRAIVNRI